MVQSAGSFYPLVVARGPEIRSNAAVITVPILNVRATSFSYGA
jgi:hypothetical protein